ncbi:MAG: carbohydrate kinase family protein, partial [Chloroflexota bacterium]
GSPGDLGLMRVTVVGDSALDVTVRPAHAPRPGGDVPARIGLSPGGQGANVAVRLARAGVIVTLATAVADDAAGRILAAALERDGVIMRQLPAERSGVVVALLDAGAERAMLSDRVTLTPDEVAAACEGANWVHCSAYPLADDASGDELARVIGSLPASTRISAGGGSLPPDAARAERVRGRLASAGARLLIFGRDEAAALLDAPLPSLAAAADAMASAFPGVIAIVTGGAAGSTAAGPGFALSVAADESATPRVDATGAGDAYAAAVIAALLPVDWPPDVPILRAGMEAGSRLGGLVSRVVGAQARVDGEPRAAT